MKKVGRVMTWSESETDRGVRGGEGVSGAEKSGKQIFTLGSS